jgi:hypothetical protein
VNTAGESRREGRGLGETTAQRLFYKVFMPLAVLANLALGVKILTGLGPQSWAEWLQVCTGAFCCLVAGWLAAAAWSRSYWSRSMAAQVALWRRIADAFFAWLEQEPVPEESLRTLKSSLDEVVPDSTRR